MSVILNVSQVEKYFGGSGSVNRALDNISFTVEKGELFSAFIINKFENSVNL